MPIYEYQCGKCGKTLEALQKVSDAPLTECPECGGPLSKLISRTSFQLKGTGWYATDYKKLSSSGGKGESDSGASKPSESPKKSEPSGSQS